MIEQIAEDDTIKLNLSLRLLIRMRIYIKKETNESTSVKHTRLSACLEIHSKHYESTFYSKDTLHFW